MKRKIITALAAAAILTSSLSLASCGNSSDIIGVSLPNQSTSLNVGIGDNIKKIFEPKGFDVRVQSADNSSTSQRTQVETFITMGVKMIVIAPVEVKAIYSTLQKAKDQGIKVVVSGAGDIQDGCYDAVTVSNEYLLGSYIALLAKHWVEEKYTEADSFSTLILKSSVGADAIVRSDGMASIKEPWLKDKDGNYIDAAGTVTTEANRIANPAYSSIVASHPIKEVQMGTSDNGKDLVANALLEDSHVRLVLMYGSLFAPGGSQQIVDNYTNTDDFGIFGGGVSGVEGSYMLGSLPDGVGQKITIGGTEYSGVKSVFRGAVSFGGEDAALSVSQLAEKVYYGEAGKDYVARTPELLGLWYTLNSSTKEALACFDLSKDVITDFDPAATLEDTDTVIKWSKNK